MIFLFYVTTVKHPCKALSLHTHALKIVSYLLLEHFLMELCQYLDHKQTMTGHLRFQLCNPDSRLVKTQVHSTHNTLNSQNIRNSFYSTTIQPNNFHINKRNLSGFRLSGSKTPNLTWPFGLVYSQTHTAVKTSTSFHTFVEE